MYQIFLYLSVDIYTPSRASIRASTYVDGATPEPFGLRVLTRRSHYYCPLTSTVSTTEHRCPPLTAGSPISS